MRPPNAIAAETGRATVTDAGRWLAIVLEMKRPWFALLFMAVWLCGWAAGEVVVAGVLLLNGLARFGVEAPFGDLLGGIQVSRLEGGALSFVLLWFTLWTLGGVQAIRAWVRMLWGREHIRVDAETLVVTHQVIGRDAVRRYEADRIRHLRLAPRGAISGLGGSTQAKARALGSGEDTGCFAFDYDAETHRFGGDLSRAEARRLLPLILAKLPPEAGKEAVSA